MEAVFDIRLIKDFALRRFDKDHEYRMISVLRSALSSVHEKIGGFRVGSHPYVCLLLKGISTQEPQNQSTAVFGMYLKSLST